MIPRFQVAAVVKRVWFYAEDGWNRPHFECLTHTGERIHIVGERDVQ